MGLLDSASSPWSSSEGGGNGGFFALFFGGLASSLAGETAPVVMAERDHD